MIPIFSCNHLTDCTTDVRLKINNLIKKILFSGFYRIYYHHQKNVHLNENIVENNNVILRKKINDQIQQQQQQQ